MKRVCVNRLKTDLDKLQSFVQSMEHQEETLEQLFQCILKIFENETAFGEAQKHSSQLGGQMTMAKSGLDNSQSYIFNSKANLTGLLPSDGHMSFSKATDD